MMKEYLSGSSGPLTTANLDGPEMFPRDLTCHTRNAEEWNDFHEKRGIRDQGKREYSHKELPDRMHEKLVEERHLDGPSSRADQWRKSEYFESSNGNSNARVLHNEHKLNEHKQDISYDGDSSRKVFSRSSTVHVSTHVSTNSSTGETGMDFLTYESPLDHSPQKGKSNLGKQGALNQRRRPSKGSLRLNVSPERDQIEDSINERETTNKTKFLTPEVQKRNAENYYRSQATHYETKPYQAQSKTVINKTSSKEESRQVTWSKDGKVKRTEINPKISPSSINKPRFGGAKNSTDGRSVSPSPHRPVEINDNGNNVIVINTGTWTKTDGKKYFGRSPERSPSQTVTTTSKEAKETRNQWTTKTSNHYNNNNNHETRFGDHLSPTLNTQREKSPQRSEFEVDHSKLKTTFVTVSPNRKSPTPETMTARDSMQRVARRDGHSFEVDMTRKTRFTPPANSKLQGVTILEGPTTKLVTSFSQQMSEKSRNATESWEKTTSKNSHHQTQYEGYTKKDRWPASSNASPPTHVTIDGSPSPTPSPKQPIRNQSSGSPRHAQGSPAAKTYAKNVEAHETASGHFVKETRFDDNRQSNSEDRRSIILNEIRQFDPKKLRKQYESTKVGATTAWLEGRYANYDQKHHLSDTNTTLEEKTSTTKTYYSNHVDSTPKRNHATKILLSPDQKKPQTTTHAIKPQQETRNPQRHGKHSVTRVVAVADQNVLPFERTQSLPILESMTRAKETSREERWEMIADDEDELEEELNGIYDSDEELEESWAVRRNIDWERLEPEQGQVSIINPWEDINLKKTEKLQHLINEDEAIVRGTMSLDRRANAKSSQESVSSWEWVDTYGADKTTEEEEKPEWVEIAQQRQRAYESHDLDNILIRSNSSPSFSPSWRTQIRLKATPGIPTIGDEEWGHHAIEQPRTTNKQDIQPTATHLGSVRPEWLQNVRLKKTSHLTQVKGPEVGRVLGEKHTYKQSPKEERQSTAYFKMENSRPESPVSRSFSKPRDITVDHVLSTIRLIRQASLSTPDLLTHDRPRGRSSPVSPNWRTERGSSPPAASPTQIYPRPTSPTYSSRRPLVDEAPAQASFAASPQWMIDLKTKNLNRRGKQHPSEATSDAKHEAKSMSNWSMTVNGRRSPEMKAPEGRLSQTPPRSPSPETYRSWSPRRTFSNVLEEIKSYKRDETTDRQSRFSSQGSITRSGRTSPQNKTISISGAATKHATYTPQPVRPTTLQYSTPTDKKQPSDEAEDAESPTGVSWWIQVPGETKVSNSNDRLKKFEKFVQKRVTSPPRKTSTQAATSPTRRDSPVKKSPTISPRRRSPSPPTTSRFSLHAKDRSQSLATSKSSTTSMKSTTTVTVAENISSTRTSVNKKQSPGTKTTSPISGNASRVSRNIHSKTPRSPSTSPDHKPKTPPPKHKTTFAVGNAKESPARSPAVRRGTSPLSNKSPATSERRSPSPGPNKNRPSSTSPSGYTPKRANENTSPKSPPSSTPSQKTPARSASSRSTTSSTTTVRVTSAHTKVVETSPRSPTTSRVAKTEPTSSSVSIQGRDSPDSNAAAATKGRFSQLLSDLSSPPSSPSKERFESASFLDEKRSPSPRSWTLPKRSGGASSLSSSSSFTSSSLVGQMSSSMRNLYLRKPRVRFSSTEIVWPLDQEGHAPVSTCHHPMQSKE